MKPTLYILGWPSDLGGADTKLRDTLPLWCKDYTVYVVPNKRTSLDDGHTYNYVLDCGAVALPYDELPTNMNGGTVFSMCNKRVFLDGKFKDLQQRGAYTIFSSEMMWCHEGELEACVLGHVDKVLFTSDLQKRELAYFYPRDIPVDVTSNYINIYRYLYKRPGHDAPFTIGRLSRPDPVKYPRAFPLLYESIVDCAYRVMAWSPELSEIYKWHKFDERWSLLTSCYETGPHFLSKLHVYVFQTGATFAETWGRSAIEAMAVGCPPLVSPGHHMSTLITSGVDGFICRTHNAFKRRVAQLRDDPDMMTAMSVAARDTAIKLNNPEEHRAEWRRAFEHSPRL